MLRSLRGHGMLFEGKCWAKQARRVTRKWQRMKRGSRSGNNALIEANEWAVICLRCLLEFDEQSQRARARSHARPLEPRPQTAPQPRRSASEGNPALKSTLIIEITQPPLSVRARSHPRIHIIKITPTAPECTQDDAYASGPYKASHTEARAPLTWASFRIKRPLFGGRPLRKSLLARGFSASVPSRCFVINFMWRTG